MRLRFIPILFMIFPVLTSQGGDGWIDDRSYYRLTNTYLGEAYSLDTAPDTPNAPLMAKSGNYSGQYWNHIARWLLPVDQCFLGRRPVSRHDSDGVNDPFMGQTGTYSGQCWHVTPVSGGYVRLTNDFLGNSRALDTHSGGGRELFMGDRGNYSGQFWKLSRVTP